MSQKQTKTQKYLSKYAGSGSATWITAAQYIGEIMSERRAISLKRDLPNNFWNLPEWKKWYKYQVFLAIGLLQCYEAEAIINTLISPDFQFVYSLKFKKFINAVKNYKSPVSQKNVLERADHSGMFQRDPQKKNRTIDKLKELE